MQGSDSNKYVILLTDRDEGPTLALVEMLRQSGVSALIEGLPEVEVATAVGIAAHASRARANAVATDAPPPMAVLCEVAAGASMVEIHAAVERATSAWPGVPLVACRRHDQEYARQHNLRTLNGAALQRLGFRAIADEHAQLPALLRELEERGTTGKLPPLAQAENALLHPGRLLLPERLKAATLHAAFELVAALHFAADQKSAAHTALTGLAALVRADRWTIYLTSEMSGTENGALEPLAVRGLTAREREASAQDLPHASLSDALAMSGSESKAAREASAGLGTIRRTEHGRRIVALPLIGAEKVIGVVEAVREEHDARPFNDSDTALLGALVVPLAFALANSVRIAEAERLSQTDDLTKLHNARYLRHFLLSEIRRARRYGSCVAALFLDLDDFKRINDVHGHLVGSHVLMEMAAVMLSSVRDTDMVSRYGGDEFVVILPEADIKPAAFVAERVRAKIAGHVFTGGRQLQLSLTSSFGVAAFPLHAQSPQQLIASADTAMYEAKAAGKNCVRFAAVSGD